MSPGKIGDAVVDDDEAEPARRTLNPGKANLESARHGIAMILPHDCNLPRCLLSITACQPAILYVDAKSRPNEWVF
jgi:hypothetical protein